MEDTGQQFETGKPAGGGSEADQYQKRLMALENYRYDYEGDWLDIQKYILPRKGLFFRRGQKITGKRDHSNIFDPEATLDLKDLAAALLSGMTPKTRPWLRLALQDSDMMDYQPVKEWFHGATQQMLDIFSYSNLYTTLHSTYRETAGFGTGPMLHEEDFDSLFRFTSFTTGEFYIACNARGEVDTFYRAFEMTADNIVNMFGMDRVSRDVQKEYEKGEVSISIKNAATRPDSKDKYFTICQAIQPNKKAKYGYMDNRNMPFESVYWERGKHGLLRRSGFEELSIYTARWDVVSTNHPYGESPTRDILNHVKGLQEMSKEEYRAIHQQARPAMQVPAAFKGRLSMMPGAQNVKPAGDNEKITRLFDFQFDHAGVTNKTMDVRDQIKRGLFIDLIKMIANRPGIQPLQNDEIAALEGERLVLLSPILERFQGDILNNLVKRSFNIMLRKGVLPPPPPEIQGQLMKVEYTSQLAQIQKIVGLQPINTFLGFLGPAAGLNPQVLDKVDFDEMADEFADATGLPPKIVVSDETVAAIRKARADQQAAAEREQAMAAMVGGAKELSETSMEGANALTALAGGV